MAVVADALSLAPARTIVHKCVGLSYTLATQSQLGNTFGKISWNVLLIKKLPQIWMQLQYGILTWGSVEKNELGALSTRLNKMIKTITFAKKFGHVSSIFKALNILKIDDI